MWNGIDTNNEVKCAEWKYVTVYDVVVIENESKSDHLKLQFSSSAYLSSSPTPYEDMHTHTNISP